MTPAATFRPRPFRLEPPSVSDHGLPEPFDREAHLAGEEALGAELLVSRELLAHVGIFYDTVEQITQLASRQARHLANDYAATAAAAVGGPGSGDPAVVFAAHVTRRLTHLTEGAAEVVSVITTQSQKACRALYDLWLPFHRVIVRDWSGTGPRMSAGEET